MRVHPTDVAEFPALVMAVLIDAGFVTQFPFEWTRAGRRSVKRHAFEIGGYSGTEVYQDALRMLWKDGAGPVIVRLATFDAERSQDARLTMQRRTGEAKDLAAIDPE